MFSLYCYAEFLSIVTERMNARALSSNHLDYSCNFDNSLLFKRKTMVILIEFSIVVPLN